MSNRGFSLIELTLVLLIMAIAAAGVTLNIRGPLDSAGLRDVLGAVRAFDYTTRTAAREQDRPLQLVVDLSGGRLDRADGRGRPLGTAPLALPARFRIGAVLVRGRAVTDGTAAISCSRQGLTPSYAIRVDRGERKLWVVTAGLTGAFVEVDREAEAREIVAVTGARRDAR